MPVSNNVPERVFYAPLPKPGRVLLSVFFIPVAAMLGMAAFRDAQIGTILSFAAGLFLAVAGFWIVWRERLPWQGPALVATTEGLHIWPRRRSAVFMPWSDLQSVGLDYSDHSLILHPKVREKYERPYLIWLRRPPYVSQEVRTRDGEYFLNVFEDYLPPGR